MSSLLIKVRKLNIVHILPSLDIGGAELFAYRLVSESRKHAHTVICLRANGILEAKFKSVGVTVYSLNFGSYLNFLREFFFLLKILKSIRPDIVQTWMYHADLIGGLAAKIVGIKKLYWGIRSTSVPNNKISTTRLLIWFGAKLSWCLPEMIVCNSESAVIAHQRLGYCKNKMVVIENGYETATFYLARNKRQMYRKLLGYKHTDIVIGIVGRFDPLKDHRNFIEATTKMAADICQAKFLMVGRNISLENKELMLWITQSEYAKRYMLLGEREDIPALLSAMDIFCLSSKAESFPNALVEAMASGLPCVTTDVGDGIRIVGETGVVVPPENSDALAQSLADMAKKGTKERQKLGEQAMVMVQKKYSIQAIAARYEKFYEK